MVTRTVKATLITYKAANVSAETVETMTLKAPRVFTDENAALKYVTKQNTDSNIRPLTVVSLDHEQQLYGCSDEDFLKIAVPITSRRTLNGIAGTDTPVDVADAETDNENADNG